MLSHLTFFFLFWFKLGEEPMTSGKVLINGFDLSAQKDEVNENKENAIPLNANKH